jgi:transposase
MLSRREDYAYGQPSLTRKKLRRLEITAGAPRYEGKSGIWAANAAMRQAERNLAHQAELAYKNTVRDWAATAAKAGASATPGHACQRPSKGKAARQTP